MAPKGKAKEKGKAKAESSTEETVEPLYAILLADSFETRMSPFNLETPRCLMPLANTPLIDYTMTWLLHSQINRVHVYCGAHRKQIEEHIRNSKWTTDGLFQEVQIVESNVTSIGDIMRELDRKAFIKSDFVVVHADVISNIPLTDALDAHRKRRAKDRSAVMTMVVRNSGSQTEHAWPGAPVLAYDPENKRLLAYEQTDDGNIQLDPDVLGEFSDVEITGNLIDPGIDICTPEVLALWSDNFDFQRPRQFLHQVLKDYELNGQKTFLYLLDKPGQFAYRVQHFRFYDKISKWVLGQFAHPYSPEMNILPSQKYSLQMRPSKFVYLDQNVSIPSSCKLGPRVAIGHGTAVGDSVSLEGSTVGPGSTIGANCTIKDSHLWGDNRIGPGTTITRAILGHGVRLGSHCVVEPGALIGNSVTVGDNTTVKAGSRLTLWKCLSDEDRILHALPTDPLVVGADGHGALFQDHRSDAALDADGPDAEELLVERANSLDHARTYTAPSSLRSALAEAASTKPSDTVVLGDSDAESLAALSRSPSPSHPSDSEFHHEAAAALLTSLHRSDDSSDVQVELNSLRLASNASEHAVRRAVAAAFATYLLQGVQAGGSAKVLVKDVVDAHRVLFGRIVFDKKLAEKDDQRDLILCFQKALLAPLQHRHDGEEEVERAVAGDVAGAGSILFHLITAFVGHDVVEAEGVEAWWESGESRATEELAAVKEKTRAVVEYLLQSDEEDSSDEE